MGIVAAGLGCFLRNGAVCGRGACSVFAAEEEEGCRYELLFVKCGLETEGHSVVFQVMKRREKFGLFVYYCNAMILI